MALCALGTLPQLAWAQLQVIESTSQAAAATMVQSMFGGNCVSISNVTYTGYATTTGGGRGAIGSFTNGSTTNVGLEEGFLLTTGRANNAIGPDNVNNLSFNNGQPGDVDLTLITGITTYDAATVQFDFVPFSDTLKFRYVFASEEYPEYVDGGFNDVFGFFITGPGYTGPFQNGGQNVALIPGTNVPVAIDNVNNGYSATEPSTGPCDNCQHYVDNSGGITIQFDGFTSVLTVTAVVQRCQSYHIKLAITDVGDRVLDSGVFFESRSFTAGDPIDVTIEANTASQGVFEGCSDLLFAFTRIDPSTINNPIFVDFIVGGTATEGVDFAALPQIVTIPAGQMSATMLIDALVDGQPEGTETITISLDNSACGCGAPPSATVSVYDNNDVLSATSTGSTVICPGGSATLTATASGSEGPYTYTWDNTAGSGTSVTVSPAATTTYMATVADICFGQTVTVSETVTVLNGAFSTTDPTQCPVGNSFTFNPLLSGAGYTHSWDFGDGGTSTDEAPTHSYASSGSYTVTHTIDNGSCQATSIQTVTVEDGIAATLTDIIPVSCSGLTDGSATVVVTGGAGPYTYLWSPSGQSGPTATGLSAGDHTVLVAGTAGCDALLSVTLPDSPTPVAQCQAATIYLDANGTAQLSPQQVFTGNVANCAIQSITLSQSAFSCSDIGNVNVTLTVSDNLGSTTDCVAQVTVSDTLAPVVVCQDLTVDVLPGVPATIDPAQLVSQAADPCGTVSLTVSSDVFFCAMPTPVPVTVTATDAFGNTAGCTAMVTVTGANGLSASAAQTVPVPCTGDPLGEAVVSVSGGTAPFIFSWGDGQDTQTAVGLPTGAVSVHVTDVNGCEATAGAVIVQAGGPSAELTLDTVYGCDGSISATATLAVTGTAPFSYTWSNGNTGPGPISGLGTATYNVTVTDAAGCDTTIAFSVLPRPAFGLFPVSVQSPPCASTDNGSIQVIVAGGNYPVSALWNDGQTALTATGLGPGPYSITVTDATGCTATSAFTLNAPVPIVIDILAQADPTCAGGADGSASVIASGGVAPLGLHWTPSASGGSSVNGLAAGTHTVTATDALGCTAQASITLSEPDPVLITITPDTTICSGDQLLISAFSSGGVGTVDISWDNGLGSGASQTVSPVAATTYMAMATDANGCTATGSVQVQVVTRPQAAFATAQAAPCELPAIVNLISTSVGASSFDWDHGNGAQSTGPTSFATYDQAGTYTVQLIATAAAGCADTLEQAVTVLPVPVPIGTFSMSDTCGSMFIYFSHASTDAVGVAWAFGDDSTSTEDSPFHQYLFTGTFDVTLTAYSPAGCGVTAVLDTQVVLMPVAVAAFTVSPLPAPASEGTYVFENTSAEAVSYHWDLGDGTTTDEISPEHTYTAMGDFEVVLVADNAMNCPDTARATVQTGGASTLHVPSALVLNQPGEAGLFLPKGIGLSSYSVMVFDEWGNRIWESTELNNGSPAQGWDGTYNGSPVPQGSYTWRIEAAFVSGKEWDGAADADGKVSKSGTVTVLY
jgi:PKD repeat protein